MASTEITGLSFQIEAGNANKSINQLNKLSTALSNLSNTIKDSGRSLNKIGKLATALSKLNNVKISSSIGTQLNKINDALNNISEDSISKMERLADAMNKAGSSKISITNSGSSSTDNNTNDTSETSVTPSQQVDIQPQQYSGTTEVFSDTESSSGTALSKITSIFSKAGSSISGGLSKMANSAEKSLTNMGKSLLSNLNPLSKLSGALGNATGKLGQFFSSIKRIAMYRAIRFVISQITQGLKEGINNLYQYSSAVGGTFSKSMDQMSTSLQYLKNSLGAAASPILEALAPALDVLVDKIVSVINWVGKLFAALSGKKTYTVAKKVQTSYASAAKSANSAANSAKEIKKSLMGFDEINQLNDNSTSSSGTSGGTSTSSTPSYTTMFEKVKINSSITKFSKKIKKAIEEEDWYTVGTTLGKKLNQMIDKVDWAGKGKKLGKLFRGTMMTLYYTLHEFHWSDLGKDLGVLTNNFLTEGLKKDSLGNDGFTALGRTMMIGFTGVFDTVIEWFTTTNWSDVGKAIGETLKGFFDEGFEFLKKHNWGDLGHKFVTAICDAIDGADSTGVVASIFRFIGGVAGACWSFVIGEVSEIWTRICNYFSTETDKEGGNIVAGILRGILDAISGIGDWIVNNIFYPFIQGFEEVFQINSPSKVMKKEGGHIVDGLLEGIKNLPSKVSGKFKEAVEGAKKWFKGLPTFFSGIWDKVKSTFSKLGTKIGSAISGAVKTGINNIIGGIQDTINGAIKSINGAINWINKIPGVNISKLKLLKFPKLARGGYATAETTATIGEAGKEAVLPLENHTEWADIVAQKLSYSLTGNGDLAQAIGSQVYNAIVSGNSDKPINITVYPTLNGKAIGEASVKYHNGVVAQTGVSPLTI